MRITGNRSIRANSSRRNVTAGTNVTAGAVRRNMSPIMASTMRNLDPAKRRFAQQLIANAKRSQAIMGATNTSNIMARPDFIELLPMFTQKLLVTDVAGSVAMRSRQQLIPYFKFIAENTKGETTRGDVLSSPFFNRQGKDPNFTGRVVKNEVVDPAQTALVYTPVLPGSVTIQVTKDGATTALTDTGDGKLYAAGEEAGAIDYAYGTFKVTAGTEGATVKATYQYDNENVGPRFDTPTGYGHEYGTQMAKGYLQMDEINLIAEAHELACYWSVYSAFAAQNEYGASVGEVAKQAAVSQITAEINSTVFDQIANAAAYKPQMNFDASPVLAGSVVPSDYLNMFKLKINQAAASVYQATQLNRPNRLIVGTNAASYIQMCNGFVADTNTEDNVGPYHLGALDNYEVYVAPNYDPDKYVLTTKSDDIRRNAIIFGEYMPIMSTPEVGLANMSVQSGTATMFGTAVVNPDAIVSGKILGTM